MEIDFKKARSTRAERAVERACALSAALLLAACALGEPSPPAAPERLLPTDLATPATVPEAKPAAVERVPPPPQPLPPYAAPPPPKPPFLQSAALPQATVTPVQPVLPMPRPESLVGLDPDQTESLLGPPGAIREQSPATIWSYTSSLCRLDLFFYMNMASKTLSALSYDLKNPNGQPSDALASQCLRQLTEARRNAAR